VDLVLLVGWAVTAAAATAAGLVRAGALGTLGPSWSLSFVVACAVGTWACVVEPGNRAAVRLLVSGCAALTWLAGSVWLLAAVSDGASGGGFVAANLGAQVLGLAAVTAQAASLVRYPDGVPHLVAERRLVTVLAVLAVVVPVALLLGSERVVPTWVLEWSARSDGLVLPAVDSPAYVPALSWLDPVAEVVHESALALGPLAAAIVAAARYRRLGPADRRRMAWPLVALLVLLVGLAVNALADAGALPGVAADSVAIACHVLLPVALGIGIAAPTAFDALGAVRRTVPFAVLTALVLGGYVAGAGLLGITVGGSDLRVAVVVSVLAALALDPVRRGLVRRAGRLTFGEEVTRDELLLRLGDTLEHTLDRQALAESIAGTAREGLGVQWLRLEVADGPAVHVGRPLHEGEAPVLTSHLLHGRADVGVIAVGPSVAGRSRSYARLRVDTLARQVAMALTNARLAEELQMRLAEVAASRERLVAAEETARRQIERDLHDGAQSDLAALIVRIALARNQLGRADTDRLDGTLATLQTDAADALRNLRALASGIHESVLADRGLVAAVESRTGTLPIDVQVACGPGVRETRLAPPVAGAAFFTVCEALANTLKHADARSATVRMDLEGGRLQIDVTDDGRGFDAARAEGSAGLTGLRDRVAAVGGSLRVWSSPGGGTTLTAVVPVLA
jgi:signal transduction histidine kinase